MTNFGLTTAAVLAATFHPLQDPDEATERELLSVGDPAPALTIEAWIKGDPVEAFEPGGIYVVEFWATWCAGCRQAFPHLSSLQEKYADEVVFINVATKEASKSDTPYSESLPLVRDFVANRSDMDFTVAMDAEGDPTYRDWLVASDHRALPHTFIVDQQGRIAWDGSPHSDFDLHLDRLIDGTFDIEAEAEAREFHRRVSAEVAAGREELQGLVQNDFKKAVDHAKEWRVAARNNFDVLTAIADVFSADELSKEAHSFAGDTAMLAGNLYKHERKGLIAMTFDKAARLHAKAGDFEKAVEAAQAAFEYAPFIAAGDNPDVIERIVQAYEGQLESYKAQLDESR